jgi:hypothetical protein
MSEETDNFLEHYGVKGMKWGKRKGSLKDRVKSAHLDLNQRKTAIVKRAANGNQTREEKVFTAPAKVLLGKKRFNKNMNKSLDELAKQKDRIEKGKTNLWDTLEAIQTISAFDLVVSRQDNKG